MLIDLKPDQETSYNTKISLTKYQKKMKVAKDTGYYGWNILTGIRDQCVMFAAFWYNFNDKNSPKVRQNVSRRRIFRLDWRAVVLMPESEGRLRLSLHEIISGAYFHLFFTAVVCSLLLNKPFVLFWQTSLSTWQTETNLPEALLPDSLPLGLILL